MKQNILNQIDDNSQQALLGENNLADIQLKPHNFNHRQIEIIGHFKNDAHFLLDNQILKGQVGYLVLTPFETSTGHVILVNRGWLPQEKYRKNLPTIEPIDKTIKIKGLLEIPSNNRFISKQQIHQTQTFPIVIQQINIDQLEAVLELTLLGNILNLDQNNIFGFETPPPKSQWLNPQKHYAYSLQWALLATCLIIIYISANRHSIKYKSKGS